MPYCNIRPLLLRRTRARSWGSMPFRVLPYLTFRRTN